MRYVLKAALLSITILKLNSSIAQIDTTDQTNNTDSLNFVEMFMPWTFYYFNSPDSNFVTLEDGSGYTSTEWKATIRFVMAFPGGFASAKTDFEKIKTTSESILLDTINNSLNGRKAFTVITEEIAPKGSGFENFTFIQTIVEFEKYTIGIGGGYPKSKDKEWRQKFINASLSIKKK